MMQQVATSNADIAAFAANTPQSDQQDPSFAKDFGKLLQQHQNARESSSGTQTEQNKASLNKSEQKQKGLADKGNSEQSSTASSDSKMAVQTQNIVKDTNEKSAALKTDVTAAEMATDEKSKAADGHTCAGGCADELMQEDTLAVSDAELADQVLSDINELLKQFVLAKLNVQDAEMNNKDLSASENLEPEANQTQLDESQDWSLLVDKLRTLVNGGSENASSIAGEDKQ